MSIIRVEKLGKKYLIGHDRKKGKAYRYESLRDTISHTTRGFYQRLRHPLSPNPENTDIEDFWALRDVSFEIEPGDRIGIIGRNGAGKSTLLKILSRITVPTEGRVEIEGRVASLLEVGTGFHPELTGRENIYLNGAVLGMTRSETQANFDEIVAFAEIEKFLDTPVKRYSSGMYVRLAFAVAAHLSPEILVVDEVLAVGDAAFQKKCLGKMEDVAGAGRTVLFVSHNMESIKRLCSKAILLDDGKLVTIGETVSTIASYLSTSLNTTCKTTFDPRPDCVASITSVELLNPARSGVPVIDHGTCGRFRIEYTLNENVSGMHVAVNLETVNGHHLISTADTDTEPELFARRSAGRYSAEIELPTRHFNLGQYALRASIGMPGSQVFDNKGGFFFEVIDETGDRSINQAGANRAGLLLYKIPWTSSRIAD